MESYAVGWTRSWSWTALLVSASVLGAGCGGSDNNPDADAGVDAAGDTSANPDSSSESRTAEGADGAIDSGAGGNAHSGAGGDAGNGTAAPTSLTALVSNRRETAVQLTWTAPAASSGASVEGYQVRYAKVPITPSNFDDLAVTTKVAYTGQPASPGQLDGLTIRSLYIETGYYFAVAVSEGAGHGQVVATTSPLTAHFNVSEIPSPAGGTEQFGHGLSGEGDLNGDGLADLLVGTLSGGRAYLFLGSKTFTAAPPAVTFSGANAGFGYAVAQIGDIDHDGQPDVAIADPINAEAVYIYKGRLTWPMALTDSQADYVVSTDTSYATSAFGLSLAGLGDFTGDGIDDFAIGVRGFGGGVGRAVIIPGKAAGFASVTLPNAANSIVIDGDAALDKSFFGYRVLGLGHFYSISAGTTLIVSAPGAQSSTNANAGRVYAFHGQAGTGGSISLSSADHTLVGPGAGARVGIVLANLGKMFNALPALGIGNPQDAVDIPGEHGSAYLMSGTAATGPFATKKIAHMANQNAVGGVIIGGGISGGDVSLSLIGDSIPDLVLAGQIASTLTIADGARLAAQASPIDIGATAEVTVSLPSGWISGEGTDSIITDLNGDGVADLCVGSSLQPGAVLIYW